MESRQEKFDVAVIGGGPAGMLAAIRAAELGARVVLIDKNKMLGKKLLMTGKGRCNLTQTKHGDREFIEKVGRNGKFLFSSLNAFGPEEIVSFLESRGLKTKAERGGRVFPVTDRAQSVLDKLIENLHEKKVSLLLGEKVLGFEKKGGKIESVVTKKRKLVANNFILSTGGKTYPATGSTGDGYDWVKKMGHTITEPVPVLVPVKTKEEWVKDVQGLSLKNAKISVFQNNRKQDERFGEMIFTHFGLSGPIILDVSKEIGKLLANGKVFVVIDLKPALEFPVLDKRLQRDFKNSKDKIFKNYLPELLPKKMVDLVIKFSGIDPKAKLHSIKKEERNKLAHLLKELRVEVDELLGFDQAIVTSGGVDIKEIDSKTMRSRIIGNLYFAGEIIDVDGPTGGYNLQICWSTGYVAGTSASGK